jgi:hypothetical protein
VNALGPKAFPNLKNSSGDRVHDAGHIATLNAVRID